jgi:plastocyanin
MGSVIGVPIPGPLDAGAARKAGRRHGLLAALVAGGALLGAGDLRAQAVNGCTREVALDLTSPGADRTIAAVGFAYAPGCIRIDPGQSVTFTSDFSFHPLRGGTVSAGVIQPQAGNPVPATDVGASIQVVFPTAGDFGFACGRHVASGMMGAVFVGDPPPPDALFLDGFEPTVR